MLSNNNSTTAVAQPERQQQFAAPIASGMPLPTPMAPWAMPPFNSASYTDMQIAQLHHAVQMQAVQLQMQSEQLRAQQYQLFSASPYGFPPTMMTGYPPTAGPFPPMSAAAMHPSLFPQYAQQIAYHQHHAVGGMPQYGAMLGGTSSFMQPLHHQFTQNVGVPQYPTPQPLQPQVQLPTQPQAQLLVQQAPTATTTGNPQQQPPQLPDPTTTVPQSASAPPHGGASAGMAAALNTAQLGVAAHPGSAFALPSSYASGAFASTEHLYNASAVAHRGNQGTATIATTANMASLAASMVTPPAAAIGGGSNNSYETSDPGSRTGTSQRSHTSSGDNSSSQREHRPTNRGSRADAEREARDSSVSHVTPSRNTGSSVTSGNTSNNAHGSIGGQPSAASTAGGSAPSVVVSVTARDSAQLPPPHQAPTHAELAAAVVAKASSDPQGPPPVVMPEERRQLIVKFLTQETTEVELRRLFARVGPVEHVRIICDRATGRTKGYGFVDFTNSADAVLAVKKLRGYPLCGKRLKVSFVSTLRRDAVEHRALGAMDDGEDDLKSESDDELEIDRLISSHQRTEASGTYVTTPGGHIGSNDHRSHASFSQNVPRSDGNSSSGSGERGHLASNSGGVNSNSNGGGQNSSSNNDEDSGDGDRGDARGGNSPSSGENTTAPSRDGFGILHPGTHSS
jgi:hypothetical protein